MYDLIKRQDALRIKVRDCYDHDGILYVPLRDVIKYLKNLPSAQPLNDDWEKYSDLEFSEPYYTDIQVLSQLRSMYNCFDPKEEPIYHALSMAIEALQEQKTGKWIVHTEIENVYGGIYIECSECGESYVVQHLEAEIYCRTCGSKNGR